MSRASIEEFRHNHDDADLSRHHETRTRWVVVITAAMMVGELVVGTLTHSMALTADGWHMATHAGALGLSAAAYWFARTRAGAADFSFGTGKVYALAGYTSAVILGLVALLMIVESASRLAYPVPIHFREALPVAALGLLVNLASAWLLDAGGAHPHQEHDHADGDHHHHHHEHAHGHDHNLRAAYLHVMADAFTSVLAIGALLGGRYGHWTFLDPCMGIVGGLVILKWSVGLCRGASRQLLDVVPSHEFVDRISSRVEAIDDARIADLHLWELGPGRVGCIVSIVTRAPREAGFYREAILAVADVAHLTVEVRDARQSSPAA